MKQVSKAAPNEQGNADTLALFDFDHTILNKDSSGEFIRFAFLRSRPRRQLLRLAKPILLALSLSKRTHWRRNWLYYQIAVSGLDQDGLDGLTEEFLKYLFDTKNARPYHDAMQKLQYHQSLGHRVVIISGSLQWLLERLCSHLCIEDVEIFGSDKSFFCYGENKAIKLRELNILDSHTQIYGYSDSAADIPMLSLCDYKFVVNPTSACLHKFSYSFGDSAKVLNWQ